MAPLPKMDSSLDLCIPSSAWVSVPTTDTRVGKKWLSLMTFPTSQCVTSSSLGSVWKSWKFVEKLMCDVHRLWRTPGCRRRVMGPFWAVETSRDTRSVAISDNSADYWLSAIWGLSQNFKHFTTFTQSRHTRGVNFPWPHECYGR